MSVPKPIDKLKNLNLLQTDLAAYILEEVGVDISEHDAPEIPINVDDIGLSMFGQVISNALAPNILEAKATGKYIAVVCLAFKSGPGGVQSCKAIIPTVHGAGSNPFAVMDEDQRADMISHFPTFSHNMSESSPPIMEGSIIEVSLDNPNSYWPSGTIEKILKGRPDVVPEYASLIEGALERFKDIAAWVSSGFGFIGDQPASGPFTYNDGVSSVCKDSTNGGTLSPAQCKSSAPINVTDGMAEFLRTMAEYAAKNGLPTPVVTSAYRSNKGQARAVAKNWWINGGKSNWTVASATSYITTLYGSTKGMKYHNAFMTDHVKGKVGPSGITAAATMLDGESKPNAHTISPGTTVDLRLHHSLDQLFDGFIGKMPSQTVNGSITFTWSSSAGASYAGYILSEKDHRHMTLKES